jgi:tetratricopeptide (TPR) repeat protein
MKTLLITFTLVLSGLVVFAQDKTADEIKNLSDNKQYDKVISKHASKYNDYSAKSLYYIGFAYYMKEDDNNCIKFMDLSISKDPNDSSSHYIKASTLNYMDKYDEAIKCFQTAILLKADNAEYYSGLGDSYYNLKKYDLALDAYNKATMQVKCSDRPYSMIAQIYSDSKQTDKALEAFYVAKSKISKTSPSYINALFNIGLFESLKENFDKAEPAFIELIQLEPTDYHSYAKLIQVYYHRKEYDKAKLYKEKLYSAYEKGELKDNNLKDMFCFDQFKWNGYLVKVFERYQNDSKGDIYNKHLFYVTDSDGNIVLRVQSECSPISIELGGPKYLLCANKGTTHFNSGIGFNDDVKYDALKTQAIKLFEKHLK